jgi:hypothetical protein
VSPIYPQYIVAESVSGTTNTASTPALVHNNPNHNNGESCERVELARGLRFNLTSSRQKADKPRFLFDRLGVFCDSGPSAELQPR